MRTVVDEPVLGREGNLFSQELIEKIIKNLKERYEPKMGKYRQYEFHAVVGVPFVEIIRFSRAQDVVSSS